MSNSQQVVLRALRQTETVRLQRQAWEPHPDGKGGLRPIIRSVQGDIDLPCPHCGAPLVREGHPDLIRNSYFSCPECHGKSAGQDVETGTVRPEP